MVSHHEIGTDFPGGVRYLHNGRKDQPIDKQVEILVARNVSTGSPDEMIADFEMGRLMNPRLKMAVWHISLSFNPADADRLTNGLMQTIAEGYLQKMGLDKTQYVVARHHDVSTNQHLHILASRVGDDGKTIPDGRCFLRSRDALRELVEEHQLTPPKGIQAERQHPDRLKGNELVRYELKDALREVRTKPAELPELEELLRAKQIEVRYYYKEGVATGISFAKDNVAFKGSALSQEYSLPGIQKQLAANVRSQEATRSAAEQPGSEATGPAPMVVVTPVVQVAAAQPIVGPEQQATLPSASNGTATALPPTAEPSKSTPPAASPATEGPATVSQGSIRSLSEPEIQRHQVLVDLWEAQQLRQAEQGRLDDAYIAWHELGEKVRPQVAAATHEALASGRAFPALLAEQGLAMLPATADEPLRVQHLASGQSFPSEEIHLPALLLTPNSQATAQYGLIKMRDLAERPAVERLAVVREALLEVGITVGPVEPANAGRSAQLAYGFSPQRADLDLIAPLLQNVQGSPHTLVLEAPHAWGAGSEEGYGHAVPRARWPQREGQFNKARLEIDNADQRAPGRADRLRHDLREQGVALGPLQTNAQGHLTFALRYHTLSPAIEAIDATLNRAKASTGINLRESDQAQRIRSLEAMYAPGRAAEKGTDRGM